ncbi:hypothetical protein NBRC110019_05210 [Neptunitalea chrysea]|uniref:HNH nuclease domain-containing protein n=1 Tax=Neptunitalea chrysea TaxID=1647581 RepID=A0A9W6B452_9FLAO|nr:HNH endonuclease [Neptunitalea chrysea]GLB51482.1 hypothetical protein NBRC110019_05210 [Neptunitalea chrysea]
MNFINLRNEEWKEYRKENWKEGQVFKVSNYGRVIGPKDIDRPKLLKTYQVSGYEYFMAKKVTDKNELVYIHRAVAELFLDNSEGKRFVIHNDFDKLNNHVNNLAWVTRSELTKHNMENPSVIAGKERKKTQPSFSKLTESKVKLLKRKINDPNRRTRLRILAKQFGISEMQLYRIKSGENWSHVKP